MLRSEDIFRHHCASCHRLGELGPPEPQLAAIARFLAGEARGEPAGHDPDGEKLVRPRCTSCHLFRGETDDPGGLAPELSGWASLAWTRAQLGNPGTMATYRPASMAATLPLPK